MILSDGNIMLSIIGDYGAVAERTADGSFIVSVPRNEECGIASISSSVGTPAWRMNVAGNNNTDIHGTPSQQLPLTARAGDSLVVVSGNPPVAALSVVFSPFQVGTSRKLLRGPAVGNASVPRFMREYPIYEDQIDLSKLPSVIDLDEIYRIPGQPRQGDENRIDSTQWGAARPTFASVLEKFGGGKFIDDIYGEWWVAGRVPSNVNPGYGTFFSGAMSACMLMLCSTAPVEQKRKLATFMVQVGLDMAGAFADLPNGRRLYPSGGHCHGRKIPLVLAGHLLGVEQLKNPSNYLGAVFAEDTVAYPTTWNTEPTWNAGWRFGLDAPYGDPFPKHPSEWGNSADRADFAWAVAYMGQVVPAYLGTAVAVKLMGLQDSWNPHLVRLCEQHYRGPSAGTLAALAAAGIGPLHWGTDYSVPKDFAVMSERLYGNL